LAKAIYESNLANGCHADQEDMPYSGFEGFAWVNQKNGANDYVRKHNPGKRYRTRLAR
jgi:hypothetical protein